MELLPSGVDVVSALVLLVVSYIGSAVTAAFGLGGGMLSIVALASVLPALAVVPVHGAVQIGSNGGRAWLLRDSVAREVLGWFAAGAVIGAAVASQVVVVLPGETLRMVLGVFVLWMVWGPKLLKRATPPKGFLGVGIFSTFATMFVGATGPLVAAFVSPDKFGKTGTVATNAACMTLQHSIKVVTFALLGFAFFAYLPLILAMVAVGYLGTMTGRKVLEWLPEKTFALIFKLLLTGFAIRLVWQGVDLWLQTA